MQFHRRHETMPPDAVLLEAADTRAVGEEKKPEEIPSSESEGLPEWRLQVHVYQYQTGVCSRTLFVARNEPVESLLRRAEILLKPENAAWDLFMPNPQLSSDCLALILAPSWWAQTGVSAVLVASSVSPALRLATVSYGDTPVQEVLPPDFSQMGPRCQVSLYSDVEDEPMCAAPGDLLMLHRVGGQVPELFSVQPILSNPGNNVPLSAIQRTTVQDCRRVALLGVDSEQILAQGILRCRLAAFRMCPQLRSSFGIKLRLSPILPSLASLLSVALATVTSISASLVQAVPCSLMPEL